LNTILDDERFQWLLETRVADPGAIGRAADARTRRSLIGGDGRLVIIAVDHPARRILGVGEDPRAMADRRRLLENTIRALRRPGVDGLLASPDVLDDLLLLGELEGKVVFGSMNRGGLTGSVWELDDRFTAHDAEAIDDLGLNGGKMLLRILDDDPGTVETLDACARAVSDLSRRGLAAMVEPLPVFRDEAGRIRVSADIDDITGAVTVASSLGSSSAHTWLKLPANDDPAAMMAATTLPALLLGGDPGPDRAAMIAAWRRAMEIPNVRGLVAGRSLLFPPDGDVEAATDLAVEIVHGAGS
jgi:hypothetical protein